MKQLSPEARLQLAKKLAKAIPVYEAKERQMDREQTA